MHRAASIAVAATMSGRFNSNDAAQASSEGWVMPVVLSAQLSVSSSNTQPAGRANGSHDPLDRFARTHLRSGNRHPDLAKC